jgi:hypothetical protein
MAATGTQEQFEAKVAAEASTFADMFSGLAAGFTTAGDITSSEAWRRHLATRLNINPDAENRRDTLKHVYVIFLNEVLTTITAEESAGQSVEQYGWKLDSSFELFASLMVGTLDITHPLDGD